MIYVDDPVGTGLVASLARPGGRLQDRADGAFRGDRILLI